MPTGPASIGDAGSGACQPGVVSLSVDLGLRCVGLLEGSLWLIVLDRDLVEWSLLLFASDRRLPLLVVLSAS